MFLPPGICKKPDSARVDSPYWGGGTEAANFKRNSSVIVRKRLSESVSDLQLVARAVELGGDFPDSHEHPSLERC